MSFIKDISNAGKNVGKDISSTGNDVIKDLTNAVNDMGKKIDLVEKTTLNLADKIANLAEDILKYIYNYFKDKLVLFTVFVIIILFLPHILGIINLSTNLMILAKLKAIKS